MGGVDEGISRRGHEQGESAGAGTPELEHLEFPMAATKADLREGGREDA